MKKGKSKKAKLIRISFAFLLLPFAFF